MVTTITLNKGDGSRYCSFVAQILQMEAMKKGAITMKHIGEFICHEMFICRGMDAKEMQRVAMEFQKEMMKNEINMGMINDVIGDDVDVEMVDEEMDKVLMEVAGVKMSGMNWCVK